MFTESTSNTYKELHICKKKNIYKTLFINEVLPKCLHCQLKHALFKVNHFLL